jgi:hypothetical protein
MRSAAPPRRSPARSLTPFALALVAMIAPVAPVAFARGSDRSPALPPPKPDLHEAKIADLPTTISVPLAWGRSFVVAIPGRLFHQCPRNWTSATSFEGDGTILQNVWNTTTGNSHGVAYVGSMRLPAADPKVPFLDRAARAAADFVAGFRDRYSKLEIIRLVSDPAAITLSKTTVKVDGKPTMVWRTSKYQTTLTEGGNKPGAPLTSEGILLPDALSESLCYVIVDTKGRITLDQLLDGLSIRSTKDVNPAGRIVPLNDISNALDDRFPIRLGWYTSPAGFAPTVATCRATGEIVYSEERLDAAGVVTGAHRIEHRDRADVQLLERQGGLERSLRGLDDDVPSRSIDLAPGSGRAIVLAYATKVGDRPAHAQTAVFEVDDKIWSFTWTTFGDDALAKADAAAFETLLHGMSLAVR